MKKRNGFTLIELLAVIIILAIIASSVTSIGSGALTIHFQMLQQLQLKETQPDLIANGHKLVFLQNKTRNMLDFIV